MFKLRKEDLSVYLYLKDRLLADFIEFEEKDELLYSNDLSSDTTDVYQIQSFSEPSPYERGRGLVYFDDLTGQQLVNDTTFSGTPEQSNRVTVYDTDLNVISDQNYMIDYIDGRIITTTSVVPKYIDYFWNYVSVVDEFSAITAADPPVVVLDIHGTDKTGYQLGAGKKVIRKVMVHIFASSPAERNDLTEAIYDGLYLKCCPLYELSQGSVLEYDGTFFGRKYNLNKDETLFSRATVSGTSRLLFDHVSSRNINLPLAMTKGRDEVTLSDLNAYRSKITFDLLSYTDGN